MSSQATCLYEFGPCRLDVDRRILTRAERVVPLAPKTFDLLLLLVQGQGRAISKHELMAALWPDTFVEEANLSFQISVLRKALGQDGSQLIETVPKHGYRLGTTVRGISGSGDQVPGLSTPELTRVSPSSVGNVASRKKWLAALSAVGLLAAALYAAILRGRSPEAVNHTALAAVPLTAYPGFETAPSLSPDGSRVAFAWNGLADARPDIYVKLVGPGEPIPLTTDPARDDNPAFSPDGLLVAFERFTVYGRRSKVDLYIVPSLGGAERRVAADLAGNFGMGVGPNGSVSWTPDGKWLAHWGEEQVGGIWLIAVDGSNRRRLTDDGAGPAFSEDGRRMAFIRTVGAGVALYVLPLTSELMPAGPPSRVTPGVSFIRTVAWMPGDRELVFSSSGHLGVGRLQRVALAPNRLEAAGQPELLPFGENGDAFSVSRTGRLVYSAYLRDTSLWRLSLREPDLEAVSLASSTYDEYTPDYSPDGQRLAFTSTRTGVEEIWIANADGTKPVQMTTIGGPVCANPRWSPDGQKILFHSSGPESTRELYVLHTSTRKVDRLTDDPAKDFQASWSQDGKTVYFLSDRSGRDEIWKMPAAGGTRTQVTRQGGAMAIESRDRRFLYYAKDVGSQHAIWRVPVDGGEEKPIVDGLNNPLSFAVSADGLYLSVSTTPRNTSIDFFEFKTGNRRTVAKLDKAAWLGVAVSPDQQYLLYSVFDSTSRNLMLVEKFQ